MLGKNVVDGFGLTNVDFDPCPYHILTSMGIREGMKANQVGDCDPN
jgi:hypothetical protein